MTRNRSACRMRAIMSSPTRRSASVCCARSRASSAMARARTKRSATSGSATDDLSASTDITIGPVEWRTTRLSCREQPRQVRPADSPFLRTRKSRAKHRVRGERQTARRLFFVTALTDSGSQPDRRGRSSNDVSHLCTRRCGAHRADRGRASDGAGLPLATSDHRRGLYAGGDQRFACAHYGRAAQCRLGQSVIVDNRSGVGGNIAAAYVARAPADGYTLMVGTDAIMTSNVFLYKNTPFDPVKDFAPITNAGTNIICLAVHVDLPVNSVAELIAYAKANPGKLQYGSW